MKKLKAAALLCLLCLLTAGCSKEENVKNKTVTLTYQKNKYEGQYTGLMKNGKPTEGTFSYKKGTDYLSYKGKLSGGKMSGKGTLKTNLMKPYFLGTACTGTYKGSVSDGKASGNGSFEFLTPKDLKGSVYKGNWHANMANGRGRIDFPEKEGGGAIIGSFDTGYFDPSKLDCYETVGTLVGSSYKVSSKAASFIKNNPDLFMAKDENDLALYADSSLNYADVLKNPASFGDKIMKFSSYPVLNSSLGEELFGEKFSFILLGRPSENTYIYVICLKSVKNVEINSNQTVYGLPLASSVYETKSGKKLKVLVLAGSFLKHE
ncbi:MORN protein [Anaerostipes sp.]|uniref:MORN protein n=1 Tax=Anaerostipes sp. TaxID=1872530 RepID=UPI0025C05370|nr:MORN protein [Anaerostipes sp.]MBS7009402.1 MORN protein [Anaerostipes sp.]